MIRVFLLYALSGFVSLGYQVAWFRIFADWFGSTSFTFALVVINFVAGLGVGALLSARIGNLLGKRFGMGDRLRIYGVVELIVSGTALLTIVAEQVLPGSFGTFPYYLQEGIWVQSIPYRVGQVAVAAACVFIPCTFMGVTFPLLCHAFVNAPNGSRFPAALYAWNTLGACTGVLACQFLLIRWVGHGSTFWLMAGLNALLGLYFLGSGGAPGFRAPPEAPTGAAPEVGTRAHGNERGVVLQLIALAATSGFLAGALEGDLFKRISFLIYVVPGATMSFVSFWAILAIFLASTAVHRLPRLRLTQIKIGYAAAFVYFVVVWQLAQQIELWLDPEVAIREAMILFPRSLLLLLVYVGIFTFPPFFFVSLLLPFVCNELQSRKHHLGLAYGVNTLAFCVGMVAFALAAPSVSIFYSLKLFMAVMFLVAVFVSSLSQSRRLMPWKLGAAAAALMVACVVTPKAYDPSYFKDGTAPAENLVSSVMSDAAHTTFVVATSDLDPFERRRVDSKSLYFGRMGMSGTNFASQIYMRLMAHFPLLLHPHPQKALLICFGVGNTASAIATHESIEQIDVVDLNLNVFRTAPDFGRTSGNVHLDPRVRLINDDGRSYLRSTDEIYDLITSEPPPPLAAGVYRLYSREYYQDALAHLSAQGLMAQWLPVHQMPPNVIKLAVRTFLDVFPNALLLRGFNTEWILVGSPAPIDLAQMERRFFGSPSVVEDLARIHVKHPSALTRRVLKDDGGLRVLYTPGRVISDQRNDLEHSVFQFRIGYFLRTPEGALRPGP